MTKSKQRLLAVDGVEHRVEVYLKSDPTHISHMSQQGRDKLHQIYEQAVWVDSNLNGSCIIDPFFGFHFYEEEDAVAFKLKWA